MEGGFFLRKLTRVSSSFDLFQYCWANFDRDVLWEAPFGSIFGSVRKMDFTSFIVGVV